MEPQEMYLPLVLLAERVSASASAILKSDSTRFDTDFRMLFATRLFKVVSLALFSLSNASFIPMDLSTLATSSTSPIPFVSVFSVNFSNSSAFSSGAADCM